MSRTKKDLTGQRFGDVLREKEQFEGFANSRFCPRCKQNQKPIQFVGKRFDSPTPTTTCSADCAAELKRRTHVRA